MAFKQVFLETLVETYKDAEEIRIYEDRVRHVKAFRDFFTDYNMRQNGVGGVPSRGSITAEVIQVADGATLLDPVMEAAEVQQAAHSSPTSVEHARYGGQVSSQ
ncbi:tat pathway signal sequence protein [Rutstroemia sp. NJR-2017a BBW]|nr:tat pathway signal sequence protein [Rutstroemia sp. NJR-2017a BBW]